MTVPDAVVAGSTVVGATTEPATKTLAIRLSGLCAPRRQAHQLTALWAPSVPMRSTLQEVRP